MLLIVGGFDPISGAGISVDIKTANTLNIYTPSIITCTVPQTNKEVYEKFEIPEDNIKKQFKAVFEEFDIKIVKTGVLSKDAIDILVKYIKKYNLKVICDPVLSSTTGYNFIDVKDYKKLFELSYLITPNKEEYEKIKDFNLENYILITGIDDTLIKGNKKIYEFKGYKIDKEVHGTGCCYATAIACFLYKGYDLIEAIKEAKKLVLASVIYANKSRYGYNVNPTYINKEKVLKNLYYALKLLKKFNFSLIPEVGSNIAESLILPKDINDIASLTGRIVKNKENSFYIAGDFKFGVNGHIARVVLSASKINPKVRACMNIRYDEDLIDRLKDNFKITSFNRKDEPKNVSTMEWGVSVALKKDKEADIIYDTGDVGKEPMIRVLGKDAIDVVNKVKEIEKIYKKC
ncbi:hypothetical protein J422_06466 [Methanocaldococcus villosus KIN24-T80]|uniref:Phosphomethylpyrimidine kinase n=1 Tax=Methanocaldococcus villosus KIN24-T80 TaxID=1069083 RepID=N6V074_9EURY|nr:thiamine-phosphate synthase family protein [Methanocaldococcus villosus]ENN95708.1 hypothetical protein J422_06466 [Methanocaldococcus villosus KIN24-T80]